MKIYKFLIPKPNIDGYSSVDMPKDAEVVSVGIQDDTMVLWARLQDRASFLNKTRVFIVVNTGNDFPFTTGRFIGTVTSSNGIVWHVMEAL
jgi:hypothetical protein